MRIRNAITRFLRFCVEIFFRRIEVDGLDRVPRDKPVIFAANHPNGLVDPLFLLCYSRRPVSFLGKAPLFRYPVIGWFVRKLDTIPVYRKQDNTAGSNDEMFAKARSVLRSGGSIAIFPEGTTHDDPQLRELKTGAARIALGSDLGEVLVVPTGIYYTAKHMFRSEALVVFGKPLRVEPAGEDASRVDELTDAIDAGLDAVTVQADSHAALDLIGRAEDIFTANEEQPLAQEFELRRRFVEGYHYLRTHDPARLARLQAAVAQFESALRRAKLDVHELRPRFSVATLFRVLVMLPLAIAGALVSLPAYLLVHFLANRFSKGESALLATIKFLAALALYPLTYLVAATIVGVEFGWEAGVITGLVLPFLGYIALRVYEAVDDIIGDVRALFTPRRKLLARRRAIRDEILAVEREAFGSPPTPLSSPGRGSG